MKPQYNIGDKGYECSNCGGTLEEEWGYCPECGNEIEWRRGLIKKRGAER